jgi:hypothetical protein
MRLLVEARMPTAEFNEAVADGSVGAIFERIFTELKPEAVYFTEMYGQRTCIMIVNIDDPARIPTIGEPFFLLFNAEVEFHVVMSPDDLQRAGLEELGRKWAA